MHCGCHHCCWESGAHFLPVYAQPYPAVPGRGYRRRLTRDEERELLRDQLADLRAEMEELERRLAAVEE